MKKKFIFFTMLLLTLIGGVKFNVLNAQTVEIGEGDGNSNEFPIYATGYYQYSFTQQIYKASEINHAAGTITSIAFKPYYNIGANRNLIVYLKNVEDDLLPTKTYSMNDMTPVFSGEVTFGNAGDWSIIELKEKFEYEGKNILVCINDVTGVTIGCHFYAYNTNELRSIVKYRDNTPYDLTTESFNTSSMWGSTYCSKTNSQVQFTFEASVPSVKITPESIDLGTVRTDADFFTEKAFDYSNYAVTVKAQGGAKIVTNTIEQEGDFFKIVDVYNIDGGYQYHISYNQNGTTGDKEGTLVVTYKDSESATEEKPATIPLSAVAYAATEGEAIEEPIEVTFTNNAYTHTATGMHDDYILPGEKNDGNLKDAVYTFELASDAVLTASVNGTNPIVAIYNSDFGEKDGPSSDNNYEGVQNDNGGGSSAPTTFGPYTFTTDGTELTNNFENSGWVHYAYGSHYIYTMTPSSYILTKTPFLITNDSKLTFIHMNGSGEASGEGYNVFISTDNVYGNADDIIVEECHVTDASEYKEVPLSVYAGKEYYIGLSYTNKTFMLGIDDLALTDGSAKSRSVAQTRSTNQIYRVLYPAGTYYLVAAAEGDFTLNLSTESLPAPEAVTYTAPENNATEQNNPKLTWNFGKFTEEYQLLLGTTNPPTNVVVDWTEETATSYQTENLLPNTVYYWRVDAKNSVGTTTGAVMSFVTPLNKPTAVTASKTNLYPGDETTISWTAAEGATSYNVYVNGTVKGVVSASDNEYRISNPEYNMTNNNNLGDCVQIAAVHEIEGEERESVLSSECYFKVTGYGSFAATVSVEGATMKLEGTDEFGAPQEYTIVADGNGNYAANEVLAGSYTATASAFGYKDATATVTVEYDRPALCNFVMTEKPTAPEDLLKDDVAVEEDYFDGTAIVTWTGASGITQKYNIYRRNVESGDVELVAEDQNNTYGTSKLYTDEDYKNLGDGTYQYGVTTDFKSGDEELLKEIFTQNPVTYSGWTQTYNSSSYYWRFVNNVYYYYNANYGYKYINAYSGQSAFLVNSNYNTSPSSESTLVTKTLDLTGVSSPSLNFYYNNVSYKNFSNPIYVEVQVVGESTWSELKTLSGTTNGWVNSGNIDLQSYSNKQIKIRFRSAVNNSSVIGIDDVIVSKPIYSESAPVWSNTIKKGGIVFTNAGGDNRWDNENNWSNNTVPGAEDEVTIKATATISSNVNVKYLAISGGALTINSGATLTVTGELVNNDEYDLTINDGAQVFHNSENVKARFAMDIVAPTTWSSENTDGWQFIAAPFVNNTAPIANFTSPNSSTIVYDLYKYNGVNAGAEWDNQKDNSGTWGYYFENGVGYLASYPEERTAYLSGTLNNASSHTWNFTYNNDEQPLANFHLLGNPFTFNMDMNNAIFTNMVQGVAIVTAQGGYNYEVTSIPVGDGFFVKAINENPSFSYNAASKATRGEKANSLNITATGNAGKDNVVINFAGKSEGFDKLQNFNDAIATVYVAEDGKNYGIYNCDADVQEVALSFNANKMGNYTISIEPNGKFETVTLVDRFTGIETNMLVEDYNFTAMSEENPNRFIVRFANGQESTDDSHFVYQSGEELILNIQGEVQIVDVLGRVVYNGEANNDINRINVSSFNSGAYMVRVMNGNDVKVEKVVIY